MSKLIHFIQPSDSDRHAIDLITDCWSRNLPFTQARVKLSKAGFYLAQDQYDHLCALLTSDLELSIGERQNEVKEFSA